MLELSTIIALAVYFLHLTTTEGHINEWVSRVCDEWPDKLKKLLYDCPTCMTPWWGSIYLVVRGLCFGTWPHWFEWITILFVAATIATVVNYLVEACKAIIKYVESKCE